MSVQKLNFSSVKQSKKGFTTYLNDVVQNIRDGFILGVYTYLATLPPDWDINRVHLGRHFNVGRDKINKALSWLNDNYLIEYKQEHGENGKFLGTYIEVQDGIEFIDNFNKNQVRSTATLKSRATVLPCTGKSAPTNNTLITNSTLTKKDTIIIPPFLDKDLFERFKDHRKKIKKPMTDHSIVLLIKKLTKLSNNGINVNNLLEESIINGWSGVWEQRKNNYPDKNENNKNEIKSTVKEWAPGNPDYDRLHYSVNH